MDILNKIVENKASRTNGISYRKLRMLSDLLNNYLVDWSRIVFDFLKEDVWSGINKKTGGLKKNLGFGFMIGELLKSKGVTLREGSPIHRTHFHMKPKPPGYDKRKAIAMGVQFSTTHKKKSKTLVAKGAPSASATKKSSTSQAPEAVTKKTTPKASKKAPTKTQADPLKKPSMKVSKKKAPTPPII